jgi:peptidyl-prolyl cis-trans isomerase C
MKCRGLNINRGAVVPLIFCFLFAGLWGCDKLNFLAPKKKAEAKKEFPVIQVKGTVIATVNNYPITLEDLEQEIASYNEMMKDQPAQQIKTRDQKINYLRDEMERRILLYQEALARGLDRKEEVVQALEKTKQDLLVMELISQESQKIPEASSDEIKSFYKANQDQLKEPEERQIREIVVPSEQEAKDTLVQLLQGADFATLAKERSKSPSAKDGGDLGFIQKGKKFLQFDTVAFSDTLEVGRMSNIFKDPDGYIILKLEAKRGGKPKSEAEMWNDIKNGLTYLKRQENMANLIKKLKGEASVVENLEGKIK